MRILAWFLLIGSGVPLIASTVLFIHVIVQIPVFDQGSTALSLVLFSFGSVAAILGVALLNV